VCFWVLYIFRFLLICQWGSLDLTHILMVFLFGKYFRTPYQNSSENRLAKLQKTFFNDFSLICGPTSLTFLSKIFWWLLGPRRLVLALRNLGRIATLFLENFTLQITNPLILENDWFCGEVLGLHFWVLVAEIKLSNFSWLVENFSSHVLLLAAQAYIFRKFILWFFHSNFHFLV